MTRTLLPPDFADLLRCLNDAGADYLLVGGYAVMAHGHLRATQDLDVWVRPTRANAQRVMEAMGLFGLPPGLTADDLIESTRGCPLFDVDAGALRAFLGKEGGRAGSGPGERRVTPPQKRI